MKKSGFNTASGKYCCNYKQRSNFIGTRNEVSIPQAVSTVATQNIWDIKTPTDSLSFQYRKR